MTFAMRIKEYADRSRPRFCCDSVCENNGTSVRPHSGFDAPPAWGMPQRRSGYLPFLLLLSFNFLLTNALLVRGTFYRRQLYLLGICRWNFLGYVIVSFLRRRQPCCSAGCLTCRNIFPETRHSSSISLIHSLLKLSSFNFFCILKRVYKNSLLYALKSI